jgi:hypothetical protein
MLVHGWSSTVITWSTSCTVPLFRTTHASAFVVHLSVWIVGPSYASVRTSLWDASPPYWQGCGASVKNSRVHLYPPLMQETVMCSCSYGPPRKLIIVWSSMVIAWSASRSISLFRTTRTYMCVMRLPVLIVGPSCARVSTLLGDASQPSWRDFGAFIEKNGHT